MQCGICGKPLTDPISIELGVGPVCRLNLKIAAAKNRTGNLFNPRAEYSYTVRDGVVCITDHDNGKSVTNDVEAVLEDIAADGINLIKHRVIYRDSYKIWDEIVLSKGSYSTFRSLNEKSLDAALAKLREPAPTRLRES